MKLKNYFLLSAMIVLFSLFSKAQTTAIPATIKKTFYYSFENVMSESQIERLKTDVYALKGVSEVKSEYKAEKGKGQIMVVVIEKQVTKESDKTFDIRDLKFAISNNQLTPLELTQEESILEQ